MRRLGSAVAFASAILATLFSASAACALSTVRLTAPTSVVPLGGEVSVDLVADLGAPALGFGFDIHLDAPHLVLLEPPTVGAAWLPVPGSDGDGLAGIAYPTAVTGSSVILATLHFTATSLGSVTLEPGTTPGDLSEGIALDPSGFDSLQLEPLTLEVVIPEPSRMLLVLLGVLMLGGIARRRPGAGRQRPRRGPWVAAAALLGVAPVAPAPAGPNLIPNGSFESFPGSSCSFPDDWYAIHNSPEHFHSGCSSTLSNGVGGAAAGDAWVLLRSFQGTHSDYDEAIGVKTTEPLRTGCEYKATLQIATRSPLLRGGGHYKLHLSEPKLSALSDETCISIYPGKTQCGGGLNASTFEGSGWGPFGYSFRAKAPWHHFGVEAARGWHLEIDDVQLKATASLAATASFEVVSATEDGVLVDATASQNEDRHWWGVCQVTPGGGCTDYWDQWFAGQATRRKLPYAFRGCRTYRIKHAVQNCVTAWDEQEVEISIPGANPPPGMKAWWSGEFDTHDRISPLHEGAWLPDADAASYGPSRVLGGFRFDGTSCIQVPASYQLELLNELTIDAWVRPTAHGGVQPIVENIAANFYDASGYSLFLRDGELAFWLAHGLQFHEYRAGIVLPEGVWSHVAVTVDRLDPEGVRLYVNGVEASHAAPPSVPVPPGADVHLGCGSEIGESEPGYVGTVLPYFDPAHFVGGIDEVEVFQRALDPAEIATLHGAGGFGKCVESDGLGVPQVRSFCVDREPLDVVANLCNYTSQTTTYDLAVEGLPVGARDGECTAAGPDETAGEIAITSINPRTIPAGFCVPIKLAVQPLASLPNGGSGVACYQLRASNPITGYVTAAEGTLRAGTMACPDPGDATDFGPILFDPRYLHGVNVTLPPPPTGPGGGLPASLPYRLSLFAPGVPPAAGGLSLDGLAPGTPVVGTVAISSDPDAGPPGVPVELGAQLHEPQRQYQLLVEVDPEADGSYVPVDSRVVRTAMAPQVCPDQSDLDGDGVVGDGDLALLQPSIGLSTGDPGYLAAGDLDDDGSVTLADYQIWLACRRAWVGAPDLVSAPPLGRPSSPGDADGDGVLDDQDVCPSVSDPTQADGDADGVGDACDACPALAPPEGAGPDGCVPPVPLDAPACSDGIDNDLDGAVDYPADTVCTSPDGVSESSYCSDGGDNDGDGLADYPDDPDCLSAAWLSEEPACGNGIDDDGDGWTDYPDDPDCSDASDPSEGSSACGLGVELVLLAPWLGALARRRRRRR
jgi:hypothetical protein